MTVWKRRTLSVLLILGWSGIALAQNAHGETASNLPAEALAAADLTDNYRVTPNIVYSKAGAYEARLDVYRRKGAGAKETLVYIHGGGWRGGPSKEEYSLWFQPFLTLGWNVVNVEYRPSTIAKAPAAVEDCTCALRWVARNAKQYDFDLKRLVVMGHSAGAHLALMMAMAPTSAGFDGQCKSAEAPKIAAVVDWFGITDVGDILEGSHTQSFAQQWVGDAPNQQERARLVSPLNYVRKGLAPTIIIHGDKDPKVPYSQAVRLHEALTAADVANELVTVPGGGHGGYGTEQTRQAYIKVFAFLSAHGLSVAGDK